MSPPSLRVFITGGAGFLGINLVRHLLRHGHSAVSYDIAAFDYPERQDPRVTVVTGDIRDRASLARAIPGADVVVHAAAALPLYTPDDIRTTDIDGTRNVLEAAVAAGVARVVHVSSTAVYGIPDHHPLREDDRLEGVGPYGEAKIAAEAICLEHRGRGLCVPILRPKSFIGPERLGVFALLYDWAYTGHNFPIIGTGRNLYQYLDVEDLCEAIRLCCTLPPERTNDTFNVGAKVFGTVRDDFQAVLDHAGHGKKVVPIPLAWLMVAVLRGLERLGLSPLYKWVYETVYRDSFVSIEKAERQLGFAPRHSNRDALIRNFDWYVTNLPRFERTSGVTHRVPWSQGALRLAKLVF